MISIILFFSVGRCFPDWDGVEVTDHSNTGIIQILNSVGLLSVCFPLSQIASQEEQQGFHSGYSFSFEKFRMTVMEN